MVPARCLLARDRTWTSAAALPYPTARGINRDARADLAGTTNLIAAPRVHSIVVSGRFRVAAIPGVFGSAVALCSANFIRRRSMTSRSTMASGSAPPIRRPTPFRLRSVAMTRLDFDQGLPSRQRLVRPDDPDILSQLTQGSWLKAAGRPHPQLLGLPAAPVIADVVPALGFAAALG